MASKMSLFLKCKGCSSNYSFESLLGGQNTKDIGENFSLKKSIYGPYMEHKITKKKIPIPDFLWEQINEENAITGLF